MALSTPHIAENCVKSLNSKTRKGKRTMDKKVFLLDKERYTSQQVESLNEKDLEEWVAEEDDLTNICTYHYTIIKIDANSYSTADEAIKEEMPCVNADDYYIRSFGFGEDEPNKKRGLRKGQIGYKGFWYPVAYIWSDFAKDDLMVADEQLWNDLKGGVEKQEEDAMALDNEVFYYVASLIEFENDEDALIDYIKKSTDLDFI